MEFAHEILNDARFGVVLKGFVSFFVVLKMKERTRTQLLANKGVALYVRYRIGFKKP